MSNLKTIPDDGTIVALDVTPLLGGQGREGLANLGDNAATTTGVLLEGHAKLPSGGEPEADSDGWFTLLSGVAGGNAPVVEISDLPDFIRAGAAATAPIVLEGIQ